MIVTIRVIAIRYRVQRNKMNMYLVFIEFINYLTTNSNSECEGKKTTIRHYLIQPFLLIKKKPPFNPIYLIKLLISSILLCINTFVCLKINKYSTGLFCQLHSEKPNCTKIDFVLINVKKFYKISSR